MGPLERFAIFSREQDHAQKASGTNTTADTTVDLASYVEFQRSHRLVVRAHKEALMAIRAFWGLLLQSKVNFNHLSKAVRRIEETVKVAERAYRGVLARHASSARIVRLYGKFLETVKFDPWAASKWYMEAERLEEAAEHSKAATQLGGIESLLPQSNSGDRDLSVMEGLSFICINAQGQIVVASPEAHTLLGYSKNELKGRDLGVILPPPFSERHTAYVRQYVQTGVSALLGRRLEVMVLTSRQVLAVRLHVTKISGLNEDSVFLGMIEPMPPGANGARLWVLGTGVVVAADAVLCDWLGYESTDLAGKPLEELLVEKEAVRATIKSWNRIYNTMGLTRPAGGRQRRHNNATSESGGGGGGGTALAELQAASSTAATGASPSSLVQIGTEAAQGQGMQPLVLPRVTWRHKYWDSLEFDTIIQPGAVGSVKMHSVIVRRVATRHTSPVSGPALHDMLLVTDHQGQILHVTTALAAALGRSVEAVRAGGLAMLVPEPSSVMHGPWLQELANSMSFGHLSSPLYKVPPYSCRSGKAVSLCSYSDIHGSGVKQFQVSVVQRLVEGGSSKIHVVSLTPRTLEEALSERRMRLTLDLRGNIIDADTTTPTELFGIDPRVLVGSCVAQLVDVFSRDESYDEAFGPLDQVIALGARRQQLRRPSGCSGPLSDPAIAAGSSCAPPAGEEKEDIVVTAAKAFPAAFAAQLSQALLELAHRSAECPDSSWRVGVKLPPDEAAMAELQQLAAASILRPKDLARAPQLIGAKTVPAVMTLRLVRRQPQQLQQQPPPGKQQLQLQQQPQQPCRETVPSRALPRKQTSRFFLEPDTSAGSGPAGAIHITAPPPHPQILPQRIPDDRLVLSIPSGAWNAGTYRFSGGGNGASSLNQASLLPAAVTTNKHSIAILGGSGYAGGGDRQQQRARRAGAAAVTEGTERPGAALSLCTTAAASLPAATAGCVVPASSSQLPFSGARSSGSLAQPPPLHPTASAGVSVLVSAVAIAMDRAMKQTASAVPTPLEPMMTMTPMAGHRAVVEQGPSPPGTTTPATLLPPIICGLQPAGRKPAGPDPPLLPLPTPQQQLQLQKEKPQPRSQLQKEQRTSLPTPPVPQQQQLPPPQQLLNAPTCVGTCSAQGPNVGLIPTAPRVDHPSAMTAPLQPTPLAMHEVSQCGHTGNKVASSMTPAAAAATAGQIPQAVAAASAADVVGPQQILFFELELWRADLLTGVLEVDDRGKVLRADGVCPLGQAGLVLGAPLTAIVGSQVSELIPLPGGSNGVATLLAASGGGAAAGDLVRGGLKKRAPRKARPGGTTTLTVRHLSDGCALELQVTAVHRPGPPGSAYLILRPKAPTAMQPGFLRWLYCNDTSGLMSIKSRRETVNPIATGQGFNGGGGAGKLEQTRQGALLVPVEHEGPATTGASLLGTISATIGAQLASVRHTTRTAGGLSLVVEKVAATAAADLAYDEPSARPEPTTVLAAGLHATFASASTRCRPPPSQPPPLVHSIYGPSVLAAPDDPLSSMQVISSQAASTALRLPTIEGQQPSAADGARNPATASTAATGCDAGMESPLLDPAGGGELAAGPVTHPTSKVANVCGPMAAGPDLQRLVAREALMDMESEGGSRDDEEEGGAMLPAAIAGAGGSGSSAGSADDELQGTRTVLREMSRHSKLSGAKQSMVESWLLSEGRTQKPNDVASSDDGLSKAVFPASRATSFVTVVGKPLLQQSALLSSPQIVRPPTNGGNEGNTSSEEGDRQSGLVGPEGQSSEEPHGSDCDGDAVGRRAAAVPGAGKMGSGGGSSSNDDSGRESGDKDEVESEAGATSANFSIGRRFKKLHKILMSPLALQPARQLRLRALVAVLLILLAHTVTFALLLVKLLRQKDAVTDLHSVADAARNVHEIAINGRALESLYTGKSFTPNLKLFGDPTQVAIDGLYADLLEVSHSMKKLHHSVYLGFRAPLRLPTSYGLRSIWDDPLLEVKLYYDINDANQTVTPQQLVATAGVNMTISSGAAYSVLHMGLWDAGNYYLTKAFDLFNNGPTIMEQPGADFASWSTWRFIYDNGMSVIFPAYLDTLDALVELTVAQSRDIYNLQLLVVCLEAGLLCVFICTFMWAVSQKYSNERHALYGVFLQIPTGVTRSLANMSLKLEATNDDEESDDELQLHHLHAAHGGGGAASSHAIEHEGVLTDGVIKAAAQRRRTSFFGADAGGGADDGGGGGERSLSLVGGGGGRSGRTVSEFSARSSAHLVSSAAAVKGPFTGLRSVMSAAVSYLAVWRRRGKVAPNASATSTGLLTKQASLLGIGRRKRRLIFSNRLSYQLVAPFLLWGAAIVAVNLTGYTLVKSMTAPIATLNIVNTVVIRFHRVLFYSLEVAAALTASLCNALKPNLVKELTDWKLEYAAMLYGNEVVPDGKDRHFRLATTGVLFGGYNTPAEVLYRTGACLAEDKEVCQPSGSPWFEATRNGLDVILKTQFLAVDSLVQQPPEASGLNSSEFRFLWATSQTDMEGGLVEMSKMYLSEVLGSYRVAATEQIAMFCVTWACAALFLLIQIRPIMKRAQNEMRRVAELLSQLPPEVDCEGMVKAMILSSQQQQQQQQGKAGKGCGSVGGLLISAGGLGGGTRGGGSGGTGGLMAADTFCTQKTLVLF